MARKLCAGTVLVLLGAAVVAVSRHEDGTTSHPSVIVGLAFALAGVWVIAHAVLTRARR